MSTLELPSVREEAWRWSNLSGLEALVEAPRVEVRQPAPSFIGLDGPRLVFIDGVLDAAASKPGPLVLEQLSLATDHPLGRQATGPGWSLALGQEHALDPIEIVHIGSGGEKKRNEMVQMGIIGPKLAILDETDSGLDIDALRVVGDGINRIMRAPDKAVLLITHYQRLLDYVKPDFVHVLADGRIVRSGGAELAHELEREGYGALAA